MNFGKLNKTVILIDTDFLNEKTKELLVFYRDLYPEKEFKQIDVVQLITSFATQSGVNEKGSTVDVIFAHTLEDSDLYFCKPSELVSEINETTFENEIAIFFIRSYFADEDESCREHFINMLEQIYNDKNVTRIIIIADNSEINDQLNLMQSESKKDLFMIKNYHSEINVPIKFFNIDYIIGNLLGLLPGDL